jgi:hypothetical protein
MISESRIFRIMWSFTKFIKSLNDSADLILSETFYHQCDFFNDEWFILDFVVFTRGFELIISLFDSTRLLSMIDFVIFEALWIDRRAFVLWTSVAITFDAFFVFIRVVFFVFILFILSFVVLDFSFFLMKFIIFSARWQFSSFARFWNRLMRNENLFSLRIDFISTVR